MSLVKAEFSQEFYESLTDDQRGAMTIIGVNVEGFDYSGDDTWIDLQYTAKKAYKKLKEREYILRHNK